jgi:hypothetical protein
LSSTFSRVLEKTTFFILFTLFTNSIVLSVCGLIRPHFGGQSFDKPRVRIK